MKVSRPQTTTAFVGQSGRMMRQWAHFFRDLYRFFDSNASETELGLVKQSELVGDVVSPDASAAPATYNQSQVQGLVDLTNELKAQVNDLIAKSKAAGQMNDS